MPQSNFSISPSNIEHLSDNSSDYYRDYGYDSSFNMEPTDNVFIFNPLSQAIDSQTIAGYAATAPWAFSNLSDAGIDIQASSQPPHENASQPLHEHASQPLHEHTSQTPIKRRIGAYKQPFDKLIRQKNMSVAEMNKILALELGDGDGTLKTYPDLVPKIFPDSVLPQGLDLISIAKDEDRVNDWITKLDVWDESNSMLVAPEKLTEPAVMQWMCCIVREVISKRHKDGSWTFTRDWTYEFCNSIIHGTDLDRKPDIALKPALVRGASMKNWKQIYSVVEVTSLDKPWTVGMRATLATKSYIMLSEQHTQRFVPTLAITNNMMYLLITDRQGQGFMLIEYQSEGTTNAALVIRVLVSLMTANWHALGFDPNVKLHTNSSLTQYRNLDVLQSMQRGDVYTISMQDNSFPTPFKSQITYKVTRTIEAVKSIVGRSTRVWAAHEIVDEEKVGSSVAIKDAWVHAEVAEVEANFLLELNRKQIQGVPTLIFHETVKIWNTDENINATVNISTIANISTISNINTIANVSTIVNARNTVANINAEIQNLKLKTWEDSTKWLRAGYNDLNPRVHRRLVMKEVGIPLACFATLGELISILRDIVNALEACCNAGILHRDVSYKNVLIFLKKLDGGKRQAQGLLIDFDYATSIKKPGKIGQRTGTPLFMAIALLMNGTDNAIHHSKFDLESLFYVALFCATVLKGPRNKWWVKKDKAATGRSIPLLEWFNTHSLEYTYGQMARQKLCHMLIFHNAILSRMDKYFTPLFPGFLKLKQAIFPLDIENTHLNSPIKHKKMREILTEMLEELPEGQEMRDRPPPSEPQLEGAPAKRAHHQ